MQSVGRNEKLEGGMSGLTNFDNVSATVQVITATTFQWHCSDEFFQFLQGILENMTVVDCSLRYCQLDEVDLVHSGNWGPYSVVAQNCHGSVQSKQLSLLY